MERQLRELIGGELRRRHAIGLMESKIKPVHIANALMREEHRVVGRMADLRHLMTATAAKEPPERQQDAARRLIERSRERWGRLADEPDLKKSVLMTKVLPLLRTILGTDGAAFGATPEMSSFSSPSALTVTRDPSDDHAGAVIHKLWNGNAPEDRLSILDLLHRLTDPEQDLAHVDDLTAVLAPLAEDQRAYNPSDFLGEDLANRPFTEIDQALRAAAADLSRYEEALRPNPIATLQRIIILASVSLFAFAASRPHV
jgi:plasmid stabilization system protein ParE